MLKTGQTDLPLHGGACPSWLFARMKELARAIVEVILEENGPREILWRLSHPYWFQSLGCVLGFDWHSSGLTTTVCAALKEGAGEVARQAGLFFAGGKGLTARKTPQEIERTADLFGISSGERLIYASRMAAKVDSAAVQDGFELYHHFFVYTDQGDWAVIQQGMNEELKTARRYHWLSLTLKDFTLEPHQAVCCDVTTETLNLVSPLNLALREGALEVSRLSPDVTWGELKALTESSLYLSLPLAHAIPKSSSINKALRALYESQAQDFESLLNISGVGAGTLRALCLVAEVTFGVKASFSDPARYSFAHGGKDGHPFYVNTTDMEISYNTLRRAVKRAKLQDKTMIEALRRLALWHQEAASVRATPDIKEKTLPRKRPLLQASQLSLFPEMGEK